MIRGFLVFGSAGEKLFEKMYVPVNDIDFESAIKLVVSTGSKVSAGEMETTELFRYKFFYTANEGFVFIVITDRANLAEEISERLFALAADFLRNYKDKLTDWKGDQSVFDGFLALVNEKVTSLPIKVSLVGFGGVGKTTLQKLVSEGTPPQDYNPTFWGDRTLLRGTAFDVYTISLFDLGGQDRFIGSWPQLIARSEVAIIVTDSSPEGVQRTKDIVMPVIKERLPYSRTFVIANKQDLPGALKPEQIESILGVKAFGMVGNDPESRSTWVGILKDVIFERIDPRPSQEMKPQSA